MSFGDEESLLSSVYWSLEDKDQQDTAVFVSLSGNLLKITDSSIKVHDRFLEDQSSRNLIKLFTSESINSATLSADDPLKNLVDSLARLAQVNLGDNGRELDIYFQSSIVIGGKREHSLYILKQEHEMISSVELFKKLKGCGTADEKSHCIKEFYRENGLIDPETLETAIFSDSAIYGSFFEDEPEDLEKMMAGLKSEGGLMVSDLNMKDFPLNFQELNTIFHSFLNSKPPSKKLSILTSLHAHLTRNSNEINADTLLPLLTHVIVNLEEGHLVAKEIRFIERFAHPASLTGLNNYILTSTVHHCVLSCILISLYSCFYM